MHSIASPIQDLIRALRATAMPWIGDQIEEHIRLGNVPLFSQGVDASSATEQFISSEDSEGAGFSFAEQVSEALNIMESNVLNRIIFSEDATRCIIENFETDHVSLALIDDEGESFQLFTQQSLEAAYEFRDVIVRLRDWLTSQAPSTDRE